MRYIQRLNSVNKHNGIYTKANQCKQTQWEQRLNSVNKHNEIYTKAKQCKQTQWDIYKG